MSSEIVYEAKYRIPVNSIKEYKDFMVSIFEESDDFMRGSAPTPFSSEYTGNLKFYRNYSEHKLPVTKKFKKILGLLDNKEEITHHYNETLKNRRPEIVHKTNITIENIRETVIDVRIKTEPAAVFQESQLGIKVDEHDRNTLKRIHEKQKEFIRSKFEPYAEEVLESPSPLGRKEILLSKGLEENLPSRALKDFKEASECYRISCNQAAMAMISRGYEVALAEKLKEDFGEEKIRHYTDENGNKKFDNLSTLVDTVEEEYEIPNRLQKNDINWSRLSSVHYSDGYKINEKRVKKAFTEVEEYLEELYLK